MGESVSKERSFVTEGGRREPNSRRIGDPRPKFRGEFPPERTGVIDVGQGSSEKTERHTSSKVPGVVKYIKQVKEHLSKRDELRFGVLPSRVQAE